MNTNSDTPQGTMWTCEFCKEEYLVDDPNNVPYCYFCREEPSSVQHSEVQHSEVQQGDVFWIPDRERWEAYYEEIKARVDDPNNPNNVSPWIKKMVPWTCEFCREECLVEDPDNVPYCHFCYEEPLKKEPKEEMSCE